VRKWQIGGKSDKNVQGQRMTQERGLREGRGRSEIYGPAAQRERMQAGAGKKALRAIMEGPNTRRTYIQRKTSGKSGEVGEKRRNVLDRRGKHGIEGKQMGGDSRRWKG